MRVHSMEGSQPGHLITIKWYHSLLYPKGKARYSQLARLRTTVLAVVANAIRQEKEVLHKFSKKKKKKRNKIGR